MLSFCQLQTRFQAPVGSGLRFRASSSSSSRASSSIDNGIPISVLRLAPTGRNSAKTIGVGVLDVERESRRLSLLASTASPLGRAAGGRSGFLTTPELGLLSLLFVLSMAVGSFFSLAIVSIPTMNSLRKMAISMENLRRVVWEEVPGTLSSLKLSGLEINDLTQQLNRLRRRISGGKHANRGANKRTRDHPRREGLE